MRNKEKVFDDVQMAIDTSYLSVLMLQRAVDHRGIDIPLKDKITSYLYQLDDLMSDLRGDLIKWKKEG